MWPFSRNRIPKHLDPVVNALNTAELGHPRLPWKKSHNLNVGGIQAVGFLENTDRHCLDKLLVVSVTGQSMIDCLSGEKIARNHDQDGYDPSTLLAWDMCSSSDEPIRMAGIHGGALRTQTDDGWSVKAFPVQWPNHHFILECPDFDIYSDCNQNQNPDFDLVDINHAAVAWGFSWSGRTLVMATSSELNIWYRDNRHG